MTDARDRLGALRAAACALPGETLARSRVYETAPVGPPQPAYLNAAVLLQTELAPLALMDALLAIEVSLGRVRDPAERWGPRVIDLDLLLIEDLALAHERLTVPHPHLEERGFALVPLLEIWPDARHPVTHARFDAIAIDRAGVRATDLALA